MAMGGLLFLLVAVHFFSYISAQSEILLSPGIP